MIGNNLLLYRMVRLEHDRLLAEGQRQQLLGTVRERRSPLVARFGDVLVALGQRLQRQRPEPDRRNVNAGA